MKGKQYLRWTLTERLVMSICASRVFSFYSNETPNKKVTPNPVQRMPNVQLEIIWNDHRSICALNNYTKKYSSEGHRGEAYKSTGYP